MLFRSLYAPDIRRMLAGPILDALALGRTNAVDVRRGMAKNTEFAGKTIVATGKLENFTRSEINDQILALGAKPGSSVSKKTDYLICGEKAGSKLAKAQALGVTILSEAEFLAMIA